MTLTVNQEITLGFNFADPEPTQSMHFFSKCGKLD